jgi:hypothetical protein
MAGQLVEAGANGLVLFNRFYQPDLDIETLEVVPSLELSTSAELRLPLRWIAILHGRHRVSLAASTGVHTAEDAIKALLAGAGIALATWGPASCPSQHKPSGPFRGERPAPTRPSVRPAVLAKQGPPAPLCV